MGFIMRFFSVFLITLSLVQSVSKAEHLATPDDSKRASKRMELLTAPATLCNLEPEIQTALKLREELNHASVNDLEILSQEIKKSLSRLDENGKKLFFDELKTKLSVDKKIFSDIKGEMDKKVGFEKKGPFAFQFSFAKITGFKNSKMEEFSGILDDALILLKEDPQILSKKVTDLHPEHNQVTVLKALLLYSNIVAKNGKNLNVLAETCPDFKKLRLLYPAGAPKWLLDSTEPEYNDQLEKVALFCNKGGLNKGLWMPNHQYVYGGNMFMGEDSGEEISDFSKLETFKKAYCRGADCSSLIAYCTRSQRTSTKFMGIAARESLKQPLTDEEKKFYKEYNLDKYAADFTIFEAKSKDDLKLLKGGDIVLWPSKAHTVLFVEPDSENKERFLALELTRRDDKKEEGFMAKFQTLVDEKSATFVLRRKKIVE